jgi:hypothetical protein
MNWEKIVIVKGYFAPLIGIFLENSIFVKEFFWLGVRKRIPSPFSSILPVLPTLKKILSNLKYNTIFLSVVYLPMYVVINT